jgi:hypothetical protein
MDSARRQELEHRELLEWQQYRGFLIMHGFMPPKHWDDESDATRQPTPWEDVPPCPACGAQAMRGGLNGTAAAWCPTPGCLDLTPLPVWLRLAASARLAGTNQQVQAWLSSHEMNGVMVRYRGGRFVLHASGMVSSKHLGSIASAEDADYGAALSALAAALGETGR